MQDCSISSAPAMKKLQSCTKPSICGSAPAFYFLFHYVEHNEAWENGQHIIDGVFKCISLNGNVLVSIQIYVSERGLDSGWSNGLMSNDDSGPFY